MRGALLEGVTPFALATLRSILAGSLMVVVLVATRTRLPRTREAWWVAALMGLGNLAIPLVLLTLALQLASTVFVLLVIAMNPMLMAVTAHWLLPDEPLLLRRLAGLGVGFVGVAVLLLSGDSGLAEGGDPLKAGILAGVSTLFMSLSTVLGRKYQTLFDPLPLAGSMFVFGIPVLVAVMLLGEGWPDAPSGAAWLWIGYAA